MKIKSGDIVYWHGELIVFSGYVYKVDKKLATVIMPGCQRRMVPVERLSKEKLKIKWRRKRFNNYQKDTLNVE